MSVSVTITVYHGTHDDFIDEHFAIGQVSAFDNAPAFCGFWVAESRVKAEMFIDPNGARPRVLVFEMDTTNAIWSRDEHENLTEEELEALVRNGLTALLGAEGPDSHVVHDRRCLRLVVVEELEKESEWDDFEDFDEFDCP